MAEKEVLDLSPFQGRQAETQKQAADSAVIARLPETYQWALVPEQKTPQAAVEWHAIRLSGGGSDPLAVRASKKLTGDELFVANLGSTILRKHLDEVPLWRGDQWLCDSSSKTSLNTCTCRGWCSNRDLI